MFKILTNIDMFGTKVEFSIFKKNRYKTMTGGFLTCLNIVLISIFGIYIGKDFIQKNDPIIMFKEDHPESYPRPILLNPNNILVPWKLTDDEDKPVNFENIIYPNIIYTKYAKNDKNNFEMIEQTKMNITKCNKDIANMTEFTNYFSLEDWYCFDWTQSNYTFGGGWDGDYVDYFHIIFSICPDAEVYNKDVCTSNDKLKELFKTQVYFSMLYQEYYVNPDSIEDPLKLTFKNYYFLLDYNIMKQDKLFFKNVLFNDDQGWSLTEEKLYSIYSFDNMITDFTISKIDKIEEGMDSYLYIMIIYMQKSYDSYSRKYKKLQVILSTIGGLMQVLLSLTGFLYGFYNKYSRNLFIINELFEFSEIKVK